MKSLILLCYLFYAVQAYRTSKFEFTSLPSVSRMVSSASIAAAMGMLPILSTPSNADASLIPFQRDSTSISRLLVDDFFDDFNDLFSLNPSMSRMMTKNYFQRMSISLQEKKDNYEVIVDVPGVKKNDLHIEITDGLLTVNGEKKSSRQSTSGGDISNSESVNNKLTRSILLPSNIDETKITAKLEDGELIISIPKTTAALTKSRAIKIT